MDQGARRAGVLLINLGTPDAPQPGPVRRYLREFLSDPRVIDLNPVGRFLLLNLIILPFRPRKSAEAYQKIWTERGSPLRFHSEDLQKALLAELGGEVPVELGMQYGNPSIPSGLERLRQQQVERVVVVPLFPQYASSSTGSALERVYLHAARLWNMPALAVVPPFYDHPEFIAAEAAVAKEALAAFRPDHVLFSYHGLPERHVRRGDDSGMHCLTDESCCQSLGAVNRHCYRAQCFATTRALASALELPTGQHSLAFQSRLGKDPWIRPHTDHELEELARRGVKRLAVLSPAFVADCLETLEEIGLRGRESFRAAGGEELLLVPSLNAHPRWVSALGQLVREALWSPPGPGPGLAAPAAAPGAPHGA